MATSAMDPNLGAAAPMDSYKARGIGCALAIVGSFVGGAKTQPLKKQREGQGLGLRWLPFEHTTQQPTESL